MEIGAVVGIDVGFEDELPTGVVAPEVLVTVLARAECYRD